MLQAKHIHRNGSAGQTVDVASAAAMTLPLASSLVRDFHHKPYLFHSLLCSRQDEHHRAERRKNDSSCAGVLEAVSDMNGNSRGRGDRRSYFSVTNKSGRALAFIKPHTYTHTTVAGALILF